LNRVAIALSIAVIATRRAKAAAAAAVLAGATVNTFKLRSGARFVHRTVVLKVNINKAIPRRMNCLNPSQEFFAR
jgi:hypothetical protein